ncbi:helicase [Taibaiella sp. KBW10]|uniref:DEAD/DEAH box helicase n=1 Tax=Taibaiella sp. KBW10 TaxID=2153357 RepID=UPI000F59EBFB|nr:DEAD/DEAH box helicase [Taibaiella sp. KBW10]RQO31501.1 helicase [Taibaiella sp. KBW10]
MSHYTFNIADILTAMDFEALNEMQENAIAAATENENIVLLSATGSGKTLAFLIPILQQIDAAQKKTQALIVVPSRELAMQIEKVFKQMRTGLKITCCYGGHKREIEENNLIEAPYVIVGTPGRLCDHLRRSNIQTDDIKHLVLDEFDKTLELGFQEEVQFIIDSLPNIQKRMLTSATAAMSIPEFAGITEHKELNYLTGDNTPEALAIKKVLSPDKDKSKTIFDLICHLGNRPTIIFCNHRESVERTSQLLWEQGIINEYYHGAMEQRDRDAALSKFRNGSTSLLVTTDLAARGLDIPNIRYIIHYHIPLTEDSYTHRNGRTARMEASGTAILILGPDEKMPEYITEEVETIELKGAYEIPEKPKWVTVFIPLGKKDKVNKIDVVGFLSNVGELKKEDIGLIEVKDYSAFVAIRKSKATHAYTLIKEARIKGKKAKPEIIKQQFLNR